MLSRLINKSKSHLSLFTMGMGALCFLGANILLKEILSKSDYGLYSAVITYFTIIYLFGLLGLEQVFIRYSASPQKNTITTQKSQINLITVVIIITSAIGTACFLGYYSGSIRVNPFLLYAASAAMALALFLFSVFRLNSDFLLAQIISNLWKVILFFCALILFIGSIYDFTLLLNVLMGAILVTCIIALWICKKKIRFHYSPDVSVNEIVRMGLQFFISIALFIVLMFADRFLMEYKISTEEFGNYFYLTNFFLAPFSILQSYVGFKQLVFYKTNFSIDAFRSFNRNLLLFGVFLGISLIGLTQLIMYFKMVSFNFNHYAWTNILLVILGITRLYSSSITSAFEARINVRQLQYANIILIVISLIIIMFALFFVTDPELFVASIILIWLARNFTYKKLLFSQLKQEEKLTD